MKLEYEKEIEGFTGQKARLLVLKINEKEFELMHFDIPEECGSKTFEIMEELLGQVTSDADKEDIVLRVDFKKVHNI